MESLATASEILAQLKQLTDGMAQMRQNVNALKCESMLQCSSESTPQRAEAVNDNDGVVDETGDDISQPTQPLTDNCGSPRIVLVAVAKVYHGPKKWICKTCYWMMTT